MKRPKLVAKIPKEPDLEAHVRTTTVAGVEYIEVRDYIPSTKTYSRGILLPKAQKTAILAGIREA